jgi:hypothetical protein
MTYQSRDMGINHITARKNHVCYGMGIGIVVLDDVYPGFPGDVRNASAYPFPIQYEICEGVDVHAIASEDKTACRAPLIQAAKKLERMGCRAIAGECGYFAYFQKDVAEQVNVPVFMSSLLQVPLIQQLIGPDKLVGILTAGDRRNLTDAMLRAVGIDPSGNIVMAGVGEFGCRAFESLYHLNPETSVDRPEAFYDDAQDEMVRTVVAFVEAHPKIGALLFTCTGHQPFARAVQRVVDLPVFTWGTLLDYAYSVTVHRDYYGHV